IDLGLGLATISMITGVVGGSALVNYAVRNPRIDVARLRPATGGGAASLQEVQPSAGDQDAGDVGLGSISRSFGAIAVAVMIGLLILNLLRFLTNAVGSDLFDRFPLFPFTVIGGFLVQLLLTATKN